VSHEDLRGIRCEGGTHIVPEVFAYLRRSQRVREEHLVDRLQLAQRGWTVQQILDRIELHAREHRIQIANPTDQRRPLHYLAWLLRRAITADEISPTVTVQLERDKRRQEAARRYAEEAARRAQIAAEAEEIQAIIDSMRLNRSTRTKRV